MTFTLGFGKGQYGNKYISSCLFLAPVFLLLLSIPDTVQLKEIIQGCLLYSHSSPKPDVTLVHLFTCFLPQFEKPLETEVTQ